MTKFNTDQLNAIHTTNKDIIVAASAGAGKTTILVERILTLCTREKDPIDLNKIVAMTFTEAAANEMKKRLSIALNKKLKTEKNTQLIKKQLILLETAQISTIHSFCLSIIKKYYNIIGLNPKAINNILDESTINTIKDAAFNTCLYNLDNNTNLIKYFSSSLFNISDLKENVLKIIMFARASENENKFYEKCISNYKHINHINEINSNILNTFYNSIIFEINTAINFLNESLTQYNLIKEEIKDQSKQFELSKYHLENCINFLNEKNYDNFQIEFNKLNDIKFASRNLPENFKTSLKQYKDYIKEIKEDYLDIKIIINDNNILTNIVHDLILLSKNVSQEIQNLKQKYNGIDFDDMEHYAYKILTTNNNLISNQLKNEFDEILVDEFQDTNTIQNEIVKLISKGNNTFRVGDIKQSIYRFRKAKPTIMKNMMEDKNYHLISLKNNYRSKKHIVDFTNELFNQLMNIDGFNDKYEEIDNVKIGTKQQEEYKKDSIKFYSILPNEEIQSKDLKADFISSKINSMIKQGYNYNDFMILTRNHNDKIYLKKSFDKFNIPYFIDTKSGFYSSWMAQILISFLTLTINSFDEISIMAVLSSPLYNLDDETIATLVLKHNSISNVIKESNNNIIQNFNNDLSNLKSLKIISDKLTYISNINNFINENCTIQEKRNFDLFFEKTLNFEKNSINLKDFLKQIEISEDEKSSEAISISQDDNIVKVMTIHQSKGLQFNVVFLWSTSKSSHKSTSDTVLIDDELAIALNFIDTKYYVKRITPQRKALVYKEKIEDAQEYIRLLYVALTRSKNELYIVDVQNEKKSTINKNFVINNTNSTNLLLNCETKIMKKEIIENIEFDIDTTKKEEPINKINKYTTENINTLNIISPSKDTHSISLDLNFNKNTSSLTRGITMHKYIEILPNKLWTNEDISKIKDLKDEDINHLINFNNSELFSSCINTEIYHEYPFIVKIDNNIINGIIDFISISKDKIKIIDFKSDKVKDETTLIQNYKEQLKLYEKAINIIFKNKNIELYIYSFELDKAIKI